MSVLDDRQTNEAVQVMCSFLRHTARMDHTQAALSSHTLTLHQAVCEQRERTDARVRKGYA